MNFAHPWIFWSGLIAAAVPIAIHLLTRPRPVRLPLSTIRFVFEAVRDRRARHRLRDFLILALRTIAIVAFGAALARPKWGEEPLVSDREQGDAVRVVILDASQSMAAIGEGVAAIERARTLTAEHLKYRPGLRANLIVAGARALPVFPNASTNFEALREELARCRALPERLDPIRALEAAAELLAPASPDDPTRRELVIVSDFQRDNWSRADFGRLPQGTQIQLESVAPEKPPANLAILDAACRAKSFQSAEAILTVEVGNFTPSAQRVTVEVDLDSASYRLDGMCPAGRTAVLSQDVSIRATGWLTGQAKLVGVDDALPADDSRPVVFHAKAKPTFVLLTRQPAALRPSSSHFLECGLAPDSRLPDAASPTIRRMDPGSLERSAVQSAELIALDHPGLLSKDAVVLLADLLRRGRSMLYVASESIDATNLKRLEESLAGAWRPPAELMPAAGKPRREWTLADVRRDESPFRVFGDQWPAVAAKLRFSAPLGSRRLETGLADCLLASYDDGTAALMATPCGTGLLGVWNVDLAASNLAKTESFVPILSELVDRLLQRSRAPVLLACGEPLVAELPADPAAPGELRIAGPGDRNRPMGELATDGAATVWRWKSPDLPGAYRIERAGAAGPALFAAAVALPAEESRLEPIAPDVLQKRLAAGYSVYYRSALAEPTANDDLWQWFAALCAVCFLGEWAMLMVFRT